jgi:carbonic anhydrase/acetyltransferase-like protein (isoleucine patch superfamily)
MCMRASRGLVVAVVGMSVLAVGTSGSTSAANPTYFVDPTADIQGRANISFGELVYIAPFARLVAPSAERAISIGDHSDVQDNTRLIAQGGAIEIGEDVIVAHGASLLGPASVGIEGTCPGEGAFCASFISFNAQVDGAVIERDAMVSALSRVGPGVTIPSGRKTVAGKNIESQSEVEAETQPVTDADREFMSGVVHVNEAFELNYTVLAEERASNVLGINYDPGNSDFNPERDLPTLAGEPTRDPSFRNRVIGDVRVDDRKRRLSNNMGSRVAIRADEGEPFTIGNVLCMGNRVTFHALEHTSISVGDEGCYGYRSIVHGGPTDVGDTTIAGDGFTLGSYSVFFRSIAGDDVTVGYRSLVQQSDLPHGTVVPARTIMIGGVVTGTVEW